MSKRWPPHQSVDKSPHCQTLHNDNHTYQRHSQRSRQPTTTCIKHKVRLCQPKATLRVNPCSKRRTSPGRRLQEESLWNLWTSRLACSNSRRRKTRLHSRQHCSTVEPVPRRRVRVKFIFKTSQTLHVPAVRTLQRRYRYCSYCSGATY